MRTLQIRSHVAAATISIVFAALMPVAMAATCKAPTAAYKLTFPQGDQTPVKLYATNKGGRVGSVSAAEIASGLLLCSDKIGSVNEVRLPQGAAIQFEDGKAGTSDNRYWVRSNQVRFENQTAGNSKKFACERNQVKTRVAGGAAGGEACK